jgi:tRNA 2-thiouridine synthesizing protein A
MAELSLEELKNLKADKVIDARGMSCPGPLLAVKKSIAEVPSGGVMEVLSSDEGTRRDVPAWANKMNHSYLGDIEEAGYWRIFVKTR